MITSESYKKKHKHYFCIKGTLSGLRQLLAAESPLKIMKKVFLFHLESSFHSQDIKFLFWLFGHVAKQLDKKDKVKRELHSNCIFLYFNLIALEQDSITLFKIMNFFFILKLTFQHHMQKIYMTFYLLTWTCFNDVNVGKNILINSQLTRFFFAISDKKLKKTKKILKKKITPMKMTSVKV